MSVTSSIPVNPSQSELDLTLTKLNKSKISKNSVSVTDGRTDRWMDGLMDGQMDQLTMIDLN